MSVRDAELTTVGSHGVVVHFHTEGPETVVTHVGDRVVSTTGPHHAARVDGLSADTEYALVVDGADATDRLPATFRTLAPPPGRARATVAVANDVHFGEIVCGQWGENSGVGPVFSAAPGDPPYPEVMNAGAVAEILEFDPDAVVLNGDLTNRSEPEHYARFLEVYGQLGPRMHHVRGNHDAMAPLPAAINGAPFTVAVDGATLAVIDTARPGHPGGVIRDDERDFLVATAQASTDPVFVFGHHPVADPAFQTNSDEPFCLAPETTGWLMATLEAHDAFAAYYAGHTHRALVRHTHGARRVPLVEVPATKEYLGAWAALEIFDGGWTHGVQRISTPDALAWSDKTSAMVFGLYREYSFGTLADRCFTAPFT